MGGGLTGVLTGSTTRRHNFRTLELIVSHSNRASIELRFAEAMVS